MTDDKNPSGFVAWPKDRPPQYNGSGSPCDMWIGPCSCGATHTANQRAPRLAWVEGPPANPTSLGDVWIGNTKPCLPAEAGLERVASAARALVDARKQGLRGDYPADLFDGLSHALEAAGR